MTFNELATLWIADKKQYVKKSTYAASIAIPTKPPPP